MKRGVLLAAAVAAGLGCGGCGCRGAESGGKIMGKAAFFWFDSARISGSGEPFYGAYVYRHLLPEFSPQRRALRGSYAFFDGDYLPQTQVRIPHTTKEEEALLEKAEKLGSVAYIVAVFAYQKEAPFAEADRRLREGGVEGYMGMTVTPELDLDTFLAVRRDAALPAALKLDGKVLKRMDFQYMDWNTLRQLGFELP